MKKGLLKVFASLTATLTLALCAVPSVYGLATSRKISEKPVVESSQTQESTTPKTQETVLRVKRFDMLEVVGNRQICLPEYSATSVDGTDITDKVQIVCSANCEITDLGTIKLNTVGTHTVTFSVYDEVADKTVARTFTLKRHRELFNYNNLEGAVGQYTATQAEQWCVSVNKGQGLARFNMEASKLYYAEVYFHATATAKVQLGLAHVECVSDDLTTNNNSWWTTLVDAMDGMKHKFYKDLNYDFKEVSGLAREVDLTPASAETGTVAFKYAIARDGNVLYAYVNDVLVLEHEYAEIANVATTPGIFTRGIKETLENGDAYYDFQQKGGVKISNISFYGGEQASQKIASLNA